MSTPPFFLRCFLVCCVFPFAAAGLRGAAETDAAAARPPNIVFILADDLGYGDLGCYGQRTIRTPELDRLAAGGMRFTRHYGGSPVCAPSRCVLLTGRHPGNAFIRDNREVGGWDSGLGQLPLPATTGTVAAALKAAGFATGAFGKWGLGGVGTSGDPLKTGFDRFFGHNDQRHAHNYYPQYLIDDGDRLPLPGNSAVETRPSAPLPQGADPADPASYAGFSGAAYAPDLCRERALDFIRSHRDRPFFLFYPTTVPHLALQPPADALAEYPQELDEKPYTGGKGYLPHPRPRAAYAAMITRMDRDIASLTGLIRELGLEKDTLVVFTSDNGATFDVGGADSGFFGSTGGLRGNKGSVYEGGVRVPLIACWPGRIPAGRISDRVTGFEDWLPTLLELAGAARHLPPGVDGVSFAPTLLGGEQPPRPFLYREFAGSGGQQSVLAGDWKLVRRNLMAKGGAQPTLELFNLVEDPLEQGNVAEQHPAEVGRLLEIARREHSPSPVFPIPTLDAETSCVQPPPAEMAEAAGIKPPRLPWHVANIWWNFEQDIPDFESLEVDVTIDRDIPETHNLYISPAGSSLINGLQFYGGIQSNVNGWANRTDRTRVHPGKGAIFSRWSSDKKTPIGLDHVREAAPDCLVESAGYEGEFASVRRPVAWTRGTWTYRIEKADVVELEGQPHTWFNCTLKGPDGAVREVGSLRFEGRDFTYAKRHSYFVEVYATSKIPRSGIPKVNVTFSPPRINGAVPPLKRVSAYYPDKSGPASPDCAWVLPNGPNVRVEVGPIFRRDEAWRSHELHIQRP